MSNGRQIGSIVGSLIAAYFTAGTSYAAFAVAAGGAVGGAIGGALDPDKVFGPRLDDLKVQYSNYGVGIPTLYGTERFGGNVFWSTDKREVATTERSGKGGSVKTTSYAYFVNMRLLLCETPRDGSTAAIVKILKDGKLIWDATSGIPVGSALASAESPDASFILYQGHQDQLPNPEEEAFHGGPGSVSAYRGVVSIYMRDINTPSGRVPQFSFVLSNSYDDAVEIQTIATVPLSIQRYGGVCASDGAYHANFSSSTGVGLLSGYRVGADYATQIFSSAYPANNDVYGFRPIAGSRHEMLRSRRPQGGPDTGTVFVEIVDMTTGTVRPLAEFPYAAFSGGLDRFGGTAYDPISETYAFTQGLAVAGDPIFLGALSSVPCPVSYCTAIAFYDSQIYAISFVSTSSPSAINAFSIIDADTGTVVSSIAGPAGTTWDPRATAIQADANGVYLYLNSETFPGPGSVYRLSAGGTWELLCGTVKQFSSVTGETVSPHFFTDGKVAVTGPHYDGTYALTKFAAYELIPLKAKDIIADQCERAGELRYDVSALPDTDTVRGYKIANPASARANIEPILTAFGYFPVDEDGAIKFKRYADIVSVATVTFDELGQAESGSESTDTMPLQRTQEIDLPRSVTVTYIEPTKDYQTASETEIRLVTDATEDMQVQLPVCLGSSDQAKKVSQMVLYDAWRRQNQRSTTVSRKYAFVSPGDGVTIEYPRGTFKLWLVLSTNDSGALCEWNVVPGDAAIFTQTAVGATGYEGQQVAPLPAPTRAQILDIPILRDADNNAGPYVAMDSVAPVPADAELFVGDDDTSLQSRGTVSASAPLGFAETVLGSWTRNLVDETNTFTVSLGDDVFNSCTRDVLLANGGEFWAYGAPGRWEIGSSAQGDSLGGGRYILSRHLRGLFGTENNTGNHQAGDTFVLLRAAGMLRPDTGVGGIGQTKSYRAVTKGRSINSVASQTYANTGEGLQPLRPVNLRRSTNASSDITLSCDRRSRLAMNNSSGALPLGEAAESYTWDFYSSGTFATRVGSLVSTTSTLTITSAQQAAFGLTPGAAVNVRVHQVSDAVGPSSNYLQATV
ncbi:phage tail protein [Variovorax soli]|uniref:phage tail protein n=1 Tax=Variovorax soli TaxID=376815 RepID=UPI000838185C|nr:phage tail protein [Variovorax soli]